jgi:hypothetical protein
VAATVAAPPASALSPAAHTPGSKRRKQATPRSAATGSLSPVSLSSSASSSIQAYSWRGAQEEGVGECGAATAPRPSLPPLGGLHSLAPRGASHGCWGACTASRAAWAPQG